jgi:Asp-tRNA(Asn)/Glu-tRNA(Gln) amidotransferase A subunit family amidase
MEYQNVSRLSRRMFLFAGFVAAVGRATTYAQQHAPIPETLTQWLGASAKMRKLALQSCLDRIQTMEPSIHAWVQVSPQRNTGRGRLSGIPYGVKDIVETKGLATEYGSPIYKGRIGTTDATTQWRADSRIAGALWILQH